MNNIAAGTLCLDLEEFWHYKWAGVAVTPRVDLLQDSGGVHHRKTWYLVCKNIVYPRPMLLMDAAVESQQTRRICNKGEGFNPEAN